MYTPCDITVSGIADIGYLNCQFPKVFKNMFVQKLLWKCVLTYMYPLKYVCVENWINYVLVDCVNIWKLSNNVLEFSKPKL